MEFHIIHEHQLLRAINIAYIGTNDHKSNILTKALMIQKFQHTRSLLGLTNVYA
jgi:hypothetical protein